MIIRTTYQFNIDLNAADDFAVTEMQTLLRILEKETGCIEWDNERHKFEVTVQTVESP